MKNIKINSFTLYFLLIAFLCGYIKIALIIFFIVCMHELGHILITKKLGYKFVNVTIYPFGGVTRLEKDMNAPFKDEMLIALGGVFFQGLMYFILLLPLRDMTKEIFFTYNTSILLFNLLPIIPLDGSLIAFHLFNKFFSFKCSYYLYIILSFCMMILYLFINYWLSLHNYLLISLFLMKTIKAGQDFKYFYNRFLLERFLYDYPYKRISTKKGDLSVLKKETYQYFIEGNHIINEKKKLALRFDKEAKF